MKLFRKAAIQSSIGIYMESLQPGAGPWGICSINLNNDDSKYTLIASLFLWAVSHAKYIPWLDSFILTALLEMDIISIAVLHRKKSDRVFGVVRRENVK